MKRILFFLLLLVNLQLTTDNGSLSIEFGEVSAQRLMEAQLSKEVTRGWGDQWQCPYCNNWFYGYDDKNCQDHIYYECEGYNTKCPQCNELIPYDEISWHMYNECRFRTVTCPKCYEVCYAYEIEWGSHVCTFHCMCCGRPLGYDEYCDCGCDLEAIGEEPWWMKGGYPAGGSDGGYDDGGGIGGGWSPFEYDYSGLHISIHDLKLRQGVKLVSQTKLPDKLHPQTLASECVIRAYAFMAQLQGYNDETAYMTLSNIAAEEGYILALPNNGVTLDKLTNTFKSYAIISEGPNTPQNVAQFINRGIPVALVNLDEAHMVTIIGYDGKYYYTASGDPSGDATIYDKKEFEKINRLFIIDRINTPYKAPKK